MCFRYKAHVFLAWEADLLNYLFDLVPVPGTLFVCVATFWRQGVAAVAREEYLGGSLLLYLVLEATEELGEDAANTPHVNCGVILLLHHNYLWWPVPAGNDVVRESAASLLPVILLRVENLGNALPSRGCLLLLL